jgi:hypothetical protein
MLKLLKSLFGGSVFATHSVKAETVSKIQSDWATVNILLSQKSPTQLKQALITADKAMDNALRDIVPGETMGDRLKAAQNRFDQVTYNKIWEAHKLRNSVVHESGFEPPYFMLTDGVQKLKKGLEALGVRV